MLIFGISLNTLGKGKSSDFSSWSPEITNLPDAGGPMYRVDTTLEGPKITTVLCGRCPNLETIEGKPPRKFTCPSCGTELWSVEEE
tara:strand:+ start:4113 stop:4370 length:258 start_codon:yes stop_codon:yes gene_type:complete